MTVQIIGLPTDLQAEAQQHTDELTRELMLVAEQMRQKGDSDGLPVRFVELVSSLSGRYAMFTAEQEAQLSAAIAAGAADGRPHLHASRCPPRPPPATWAGSSTRSTSTASRAGCC